jgi:hypothetical protein
MSALMIPIAFVGSTTGTADTVVLPWPNAIVQEQWCAAGSSISMLWMGAVNHFPAATAP